MADTSSGVTWRLDSYFPEFGGPLMRTFKRMIRADIADLRREAAGLPTLSDETAGQWEDILLAWESLAGRFGHLNSYVGCLEAAHGENEAYGQEQAALAVLGAEFKKLEVDLLRGLRGVAETVLDAFTAREKVEPVAYFVERLRFRASLTMSREEELLAADLAIDGLSAWGRLYNRVTSRLEFDMVLEGQTQRKPISQWRALMSDPDRDVGKAAFEGGNRAWQGIEDTCASALNAIAGTRLTLYRRRGLAHFLDEPLFQAGMTRETLEAMYTAISKNLELPRAILKAKSRFFNRSGIWFFEREAPLPLADGAAYTWDDAVSMASRAFGAAYPGLKAYFHSMIENEWVESEARPGKRPGAFCTASPVTGEQRVFMTFSGALGNVTTLAHETGHAWHDHLMGGMRTFARQYPMTLAETASIFAEQILAEGIYGDEGISGAQKLLMLDADLSGAAVMLLDITVRYEFEKAFYEERANGEVPVSRLKELMVSTQRRVFGDALLEGGEDPYFWASKLHFYITGVSFYNFPYTVGFLLARALIGMFAREGKDLLPRYEAFLRMAGSGPVEAVTGRILGVDVTRPDFWEASIRSLEGPLARYRDLLAGQMPGGER